MKRLSDLKITLKTSHHPVSKTLYSLLKKRHNIEVITLPGTAKLLYNLHLLLVNIGSNLVRIFYWTPLFKSRVDNSARHLFLYGGMPYIAGSLKIIIGKGCRISGHTSFMGKITPSVTPRLIIGDNVDIGWQTTIAVGTQVVLEDNVRVAGRSFFAGYPGHPIDPTRRAMGEPCDDNQVGDIVIKKDAWLATGVMIMQGVTIGEGTIVAAGSIVTKDLPAFVLAGGVPAKPIRSVITDHKEGISYE